MIQILQLMGGKKSKTKLQSYFVVEYKSRKWLLIQQSKLFRVLAAEPEILGVGPFNYVLMHSKVGETLGGE